ncbi:uncharacterized protein LOC112529097 [Cynara cardunculus var. scolymus]|uniref:uncharacterized protein LOC112529097 n=1 Tax=Cynara cardunculus var. scolymus TaxID=59895 RepID=UPI000D6250DD|nr:uncharacterized protein LOC112529097 [Cynara cardunculus var. scolymus]
MRRLCSTNDDEKGLETLLEISMPENVFTNTGMNAAKRWQQMRNLSMTHHARLTKWLTALSTTSDGGDGPKDKQFMYLLKIASSSFIPFQVQLDRTLEMPVKDGSIEASMAKYIVRHYIAATGGHTALNSVNSMSTVCQVNMTQSQILGDGQESPTTRHISDSGAFVLCQKNPNLWYLELVVSDSTVSAGSDGSVTWSQSSLKPSQCYRGPPRPLRRFFQGLDPRSTTNLFLSTVCVGEKVIMNEDCFILKLDTSQDILNGQSTANTEIMHHTIWGYFSQRTGLLIQFEDTRLVKMKSTRKTGDYYVYYETRMESSLEDYRQIDGINIAHYGKTVTTIDRYGHGENVRWKVEETCTVKEVEFNVCCLSTDSFLPPVDVKTEE